MPKRKLTVCDFALVSIDNPRRRNVSYPNHPTYVYVLVLKNDTFYVGVSYSFKRRLEQHTSGFGARITHKHGVESVFAYWKCHSRLEARMWEDYLTPRLRRVKPSEFTLEQLRNLYRDAMKDVRAELAAEEIRQLFYQYRV